MSRHIEGRDVPYRIFLLRDTAFDDLQAYIHIFIFRLKSTSATHPFPALEKVEFTTLLLEVLFSRSCCLNYDYRRAESTGCRLHGGHSGGGCRSRRDRGQCGHG
jgi:hypothetical protein